MIQVYPNALVEMKNVYTYLNEDYSESMDHTFQLNHLIRMSRMNTKTNRSVLYFSDNSCLILRLDSDEHDTLINYWMNLQKIIKREEEECDDSDDDDED